MKQFKLRCKQYSDHKSIAIVFSIEMQYLSVKCLPASQFEFRTLACIVPLH